MQGIKVKINEESLKNVQSQFTDSIKKLREYADKNPIEIKIKSGEIDKVVKSLSELDKVMNNLNAGKFTEQIEKGINNANNVINKLNKNVGGLENVVSSTFDSINKNLSGFKGYSELEKTINSVKNSVSEFGKVTAKVDGDTGRIMSATISYIDKAGKELKEYMGWLNEVRENENGQPVEVSIFKVKNTDYKQDFQKSIKELESYEKQISKLEKQISDKGINSEKLSKSLDEFKDKIKNIKSEIQNGNDINLDEVFFGKGKGKKNIDEQFFKINDSYKKLTDKSNYHYDQLFDNEEKLFKLKQKRLKVEEGSAEAKQIKDEIDELNRRSGSTKNNIKKSKVENKEYDTQLEMIKKQNELVLNRLSRVTSARKEDIDELKKQIDLEHKLEQLYKNKNDYEKELLNPKNGREKLDLLEEEFQDTKKLIEENEKLLTDKDLINKLKYHNNMYETKTDLKIAGYMDDIDKQKEIDFKKNQIDLEKELEGHYKKKYNCEKELLNPKNGKETLDLLNKELEKTNNLINAKEKLLLDNNLINKLSNHNNNYETGTFKDIAKWMDGIDKEGELKSQKEQLLLQKQLQMLLREQYTDEAKLSKLKQGSKQYNAIEKRVAELKSEIEEKRELLTVDKLINELNEKETELIRKKNMEIAKNDDISHEQKKKALYEDLIKYTEKLYKAEVDLIGKENEEKRILESKRDLYKRIVNETNGIIENNGFKDKEDGKYSKKLGRMKDEYDIDIDNAKIANEYTNKIKDQAKAYKELEEIKKKLAKTNKELSLLDEKDIELKKLLEEEIKKLTKAKNKVQNKIDENNLKSEEKELEIEKKINSILDDVAKKKAHLTDLDNEQLNKLNEQIEKYKQLKLEQINNLRIKTNPNVFNSESVQDVIGSYGKQLGSLNANNFNPSQLNTQYQTIIATIQKVKNELKELEQEELRLKRLGSEIGSSLNLNSTNGEIIGFIRNLMGADVEINHISGDSKKLNQNLKQVEFRVKEGENAFRKYKLSIDGASNSTRLLDDGLTYTNKKIKDTTTFATKLKNVFTMLLAFQLGGNMFQAAFEGLRRGVGTVKEMNDAMIDLSKVTNLSKEQLEDMRKSANALGNDLGKSSIDIMKGFAETGRNKTLMKKPDGTDDIEGIKEFTKTAIMAANVTDLSVEGASKSLGNALITFKMGAKDAMGVLDQWNEIQNNFRISAEDLANGITAVGASAHQSGTDIQHLEGYLTAMVSTTGISGDEAGTSLKSVMSRLYRVGKDGEEDAGKSEKLLNEMGIAVRKNAHEFRSFQDVMDDLSKRWGSFNSVQQQMVAQQMAGTYHYSKFIALMNEYSIATEATKSAFNSLNSAQDENNKYLDSIEGRWEKLKNLVRELGQNLIKADSIKNVISGLSTLVEKINTFILSLKNMSAGNLTALGTFTLFAIGLKPFIGMLKNTEMAVSFLGMSFTALPQIFAKVTLAWNACKVACISFFTTLKALLFTPEGALFMLIVSGLALVAGTLVENNSKIEEHKRKVEELTGAYKNYKTAIESCGEAKLQVSTDELGKQQKELDELINKVKWTQEKANPTTSSIFEVGNIPLVGNMVADRANRAKEELQELTSVLEEQGFHLDKTKTKILEFEEAKKSLANIQLGKKIVDEAYAMRDNKKELTSLCKEYQDLTEKKGRTIKDDERMSDIALKLNDNFTDLIIVKDKDGKATIKNKELLNDKIKTMQIENTNMKINAEELIRQSKRKISQEKDETIRVMEEVKNRIEVRKKEIQTLEDEFDGKKKDGWGSGLYNWAVDKWNGYSDNIEGKKKELKSDEQTLDWYEKKEEKLQKNEDSLSLAIRNQVEEREKLNQQMQSDGKYMSDLTDKTGKAAYVVDELANALKALDLEMTRLNADMNMMSKYSDGYVKALDKKADITRGQIALLKQEIEKNKQLAGSYRDVANAIPNKTLSISTGANSAGEQVANIAKQYLGVKYTWGGNNPSEGFDCSGLVKYAFKQYGVDLQRQTYDQVQQGIAVAKNELQAGDLVFFGNKADVHHVGMYVGNGQYIHAPQSNDVVRINDLSTRPDYYGARRMLNSSGGVVAGLKGGRPKKDGNEEMDKAYSSMIDGEKQIIQKEEELYRIQLEKFNIVAGKIEFKVKNWEQMIEGAKTNAQVYKETPSFAITELSNAENLLKSKIKFIKEEQDLIQKEIASGKYTGDNLDQIKQKYTDVRVNLIKTKDELRQLQQQVVDFKFEQYVKPINNVLDKLNSELDILNTKFEFKYDEKIEVMDKIIGKTQQLVSVNQNMISELELQKTLVKKDSEAWTALQQSVDKYTKSFEENLKKIEQLRKNMFETMMNKNIKKITDALKQPLLDIEDAKYALETLDLNTNEKNGDLLLNEKVNAFENLISKTKIYREELILSIKNLVFQRDKLEQNSEEWVKMNDKVREYVKKLQDVNKEILQSQKSMEQLYEQSGSLVSDVEDKLSDLMKKAVTEEKKKLDESLKNFEEYIKNKIRLLDEEEARENYAESLDDSDKKIGKLKKSINELRLDDSSEAKSKLQELREKLEEEEKNRSKLMKKHNKDERKKALQDIIDSEKELTGNIKNELDKRYTDEQIHIMMAKALMEGYFTDIDGLLTGTKGKIITIQEAYKILEDKWGVGMTTMGDMIEKNFISKLEKAMEIMKEFGREVDGIIKIKFPEIDKDKGRDVDTDYGEGESDEPKRKSKIFGSGQDLDHARKKFGDNFDYVDITKDGFEWKDQDIDTSKDKLVGGDKVNPENKYNEGMKRLGGSDSEETNKAIDAEANRVAYDKVLNNAKKLKEGDKIKVYGTGKDLEYAKGELGYENFDYVNTGEIKDIENYKFDKDGIILSGTGAKGGVPDIDNANGLLRLWGQSGEGTRGSIRDFANLITSVLNNRNKGNGSNSNKDKGQGGNNGGHVSDTELGLSKELKKKALKENRGLKFAYYNKNASVDKENALKLRKYGYHLVEVDPKKDDVDNIYLTPNDVVVGGKIVMPIKNLNGATRLGGGNRDETQEMVDNFIKNEGIMSNLESIYNASGNIPDLVNVYVAKLKDQSNDDWHNAKNILGDVGYTYHDISKEAIQKQIKNGEKLNIDPRNSVIIGGADALRGVPNIDINGVQRLYGGNRDETAKVVQQYKNLMKRVRGYSTGGVNDFTGMAMLHGTPNSSEVVFNSKQAKQLFNFVNELPQSMLKVVPPNMSSLDTNFKPSSDIQLKVDNLINIEGNATKDIIPDLNKIGEQVIEKIKTELLINGGMSRRI